MNGPPTDVMTAPWVRVSEDRYVHRSGACFERQRFWKQKGVWIALVAIAEALVAAWLFSLFN
ncbi:MAG TPA: hypothetical protein VG457_04900 [Planctomycetota bacterium]|jgi:hypothetical protein|nr:hypothetical protein [Planctomycetota bacterium]